MFRLLALALLSLLPLPVFSQAKAPLSERDITDIAALLRMEDVRQLDAQVIQSVLGSRHPEVRRRAVMTLGRIVTETARPVLVQLRGDGDPEIVASVAWASGQQLDPSAVSWLASQLRSARPAIAREAAQALGKIRAPESRAALSAYLGSAPLSTDATVIGEALLAFGRFSADDDSTELDVQPILRWTGVADDEVRWRAAWALFRPRNPHAVAPVMAMTNDRSAEVRFWAIRALSAPVVAKSSVALDTAAARLRDALGDADRRVRTEAIRALVTYDDDASVAAIVKALSDPDMWIAVSAAESMARFSARASSVVPALVQASAAGRPLALRIAALAPLTSLSPEAARPLADALAETDNATARNAAAAARRQMDAAAARATGARGTGAQGAGGRRGAGRGNAPAAPALTARTDAEYRDLVTKYVVPAWNGAPPPRVRFETSRGAIDVVLNAGDAPFAVEYLMAIAASGEIAGSEFGRVVPNFVAQEDAIRPSGRLRDEVNRHGLRRGTLSWASVGLDTGRPGYTFGSTPQPHNEGGFTALGQIVAGLDVVDRLELGDRILSVRVIR